MIYQVRVIFGDTDQMGVVYYGNYMRFFEASRASFLRSFGKSHADLDAWGVALPVVEAHCRYRRPAHYEDVLGVDVRVSELRAASLWFAYEIHRGDERIADGTTRHAVLGNDGQLRALPPALRDAIPRIA